MPPGAHVDVHRRGWILGQRRRGHADEQSHEPADPTAPLASRSGPAALPTLLHSFAPPRPRGPTPVPDSGGRT
ncbi:hypothetical protein D187_000290 [Cystobacter fuscus DSM 2262]|uniref:Uncharacterized protein n=1 Tax=Cystobacter fuscus (strain ATCC 25194 / DSM 2262 / NBRC 100088 / M29) TaxID=1242864 RepID=S9R751_CYSF2|nr:hypothetical protein D187_000290 [Cystobacter fuscus DSM 2262]